MTLGERIKEQRKKQGFSQEKIAELIGVSRQAVTKWEGNQSIPCMENLITLAEIFEISLNELSNGVSGNAKLNSHDKLKKTPLLMDIIFIPITIFAAWNILKIPSLIGFSIMGFFIIAAQAASVLYIPLYLFLIRPHRIKVINGKRYDKDNEFVKNMPIKERVLWAVGAAASLWVCYVLWYLLSSNNIITVLNWQFLRGWSFNLFILGIILIFSSRTPLLYCVAIRRG
jgi:transcriptional regulator with XRE-family HTH domain